MTNQRQVVCLKIIPEPDPGPVVEAPPVLTASTPTVDYSCGTCGTVLLHANHGQVRNLQIHCTACGAYNVTER